MERRNFFTGKYDGTSIEEYIKKCEVIIGKPMVILGMDKFNRLC
jgi:hypothetical protein